MFSAMALFNRKKKKKTEKKSRKKKPWKKKMNRKKNDLLVLAIEAVPDGLRYRVDLGVGGVGPVLVAT